MSPIRQQNNPLILKLLREHDSLGVEQRQERQALRRRILFLMTTIKLHELEEERSLARRANQTDVYRSVSTELIRFPLATSFG
jgi:hypothetical protein